MRPFPPACQTCFCVRSLQARPQTFLEDLGETTTGGEVCREVLVLRGIRKPGQLARRGVTLGTSGLLHFSKVFTF